VDTLKRKGGKLEDASVRGIARLIGARKSTVHNAIAALISAGVVAKLGGQLVLRA
jgi:DNA-binding IclR family transcriptional regulator